MKFETTMCHSHLLSMLMMPKRMQQAVTSYQSTSPDVEGEEFNGYMETKVTFVVQDLDKFTKLWHDSYVYPSDRQQWYQMIRSGIDNWKEE